MQRVLGTSPSACLTLIFLVSLIASCHKLRNDNDSGMVNCGANLEGSAYTQIVKPDGSAFDSDNAVYAFEYIGQEWSEPKQLTPKGCLVHDGLENKSPNGMLLIKSNIDGSEVFALANRDFFLAEKRVYLKPRKNARFEWKCPIPVTRSAAPIEIALDSDGIAESAYAFRYTILANETQLLEKTQFRPEGPKLTLSEMNQIQLQDGTYTIRTELFDILADQRFTKPIALKSCALHIDTNAPGPILPSFASESDSKNKVYELGPSSLLQFPMAEEQGLKVSYCLSPATEEGVLDPSKCQQKRDFVLLSSQSFMPRDGYWKLQYVVEDEAGNQSPKYEINLVIVDSLRLSTQNNLIISAVGLLSTSVEKALDLLNTATAEFLDLKTELERSRLIRALQKSWLAIGSRETPQAFLTFPENVLAQGLLQDKRTLYVIYEPSTVQFVDLVSGERTKPIFFPDAKIFVDDFTGRIFAFEEDILKIHDPDGEPRTALILPQPVGFETLRSIPDAGVYVFESADAVLILKNEKVDSFFEKDSRLKDVHVDGDGKANKIVLLDAFSVQVEFGGDTINWQINQDDCLKGDIEAIDFSPGGRFVIVRGEENTAIVTPSGQQEECIFPTQSFAFSLDDSYLVWIDNVDRRTDVFQKFAFDIKTTEPGFPSFYRSEFLPLNCFHPQFSGKDRIIFPTADGEFLIDFKGDILAKLPPKGIIYATSEDLILFTSKNRIDIWQPLKQSSLRLVSSPRSYMDPVVLTTSRRGILYETSKGTFVDNKDWSEPRQLPISGHTIARSFNAAGDKLAFAEKQGDGALVAVYNSQDSSITPGPTMAAIKKIRWVGDQNVFMSLDQEGVLRQHRADKLLSADKIDYCSDSFVVDFGLDQSGSMLVVLCNDGTYARFLKTGGNWVNDVESAKPTNFRFSVVDPYGRGVIFVEESAYGRLHWWDFESNSGSKDLGVSDVFPDDIRFLKNTKSILACEGAQVEIVSLDNPKTRTVLLNEIESIYQLEVSEENDLIVVRIGDLIKFYSLDGQLVTSINFERAEPRAWTARIHSIFWSDQDLMLVSSNGFMEVPLTLTGQLKNFCDSFAVLDRANVPAVQTVCRNSKR